MILSAPTIRRLRPVEPFIESTKINGMTAGLSHCGYDIRIKQDVTLFPNDFALASTIERFDMPLDVMATVYNKSTWARRALTVWVTILEPGWKGYLTIEMRNDGRDLIRIRAGDPIAQVVFQQMDGPVDGYRGKYQAQADEPVAAIYELT